MDSETEIVEFKSRLSPQRVEALLAKAASQDGSIGLQGRGDVAAQLKCALGALAARTDFFSVLLNAHDPARAAHQNAPHGMTHAAFRHTRPAGQSTSKTQAGETSAADRQKPS